MNNLHLTYEKQIADLQKLLGPLNALAAQKEIPEDIHYGHIGDLGRVTALLEEANLIIKHYN